MRNKDVSIDTYLSISGIQHFAFCKRQWALIHNENLWVENRLTAEGRTEHERTHNPTIVEKRGDELVVRALQVRSDIAKVCCDYGQRVQNSVFECYLDPAQLVSFRKRILGEIDETEDSLRIYHLGDNYRNKIEKFGLKESYDPEGVLLF